MLLTHDDTHWRFLFDEKLRERKGKRERKRETIETKGKRKRETRGRKKTIELFKS